MMIGDTLMMIGDTIIMIDDTLMMIGDILIMLADSQSLSLGRAVPFDFIKLSPQWTPALMKPPFIPLLKYTTTKYRSKVGQP